jgi:predicted MFS family arabinose efflux permease
LERVADAQIAARASDALSPARSSPAGRSAVAVSAVPLLALLLVIDLGVSVMGPLIPQLQRQFRVSAGAVALALGVYNGVRLLVNMPMSQYVARARLPHTVATGGAVLVAGAAVAAAAPVFWLVVVGRAIMGLGSALFFLSVQFWLARLATPETKAQLFSYHQLAGLTGSALGPAAGGVLADWVSWRAAFALSATAGLLAAVVGRRLPAPGPSPDARARAAAAAGRPRPGDVVGPGLCMLAFLFFHGGVLTTLIPLYAAREVHLGAAAIGTLLMVGTLQRFASALLGGWLVRRYGTRPVVLGGLVALALSVLSFLAVGSAGSLLAAVSLVSWANLGGSFVIAMITDRVPEAHWGTALGVNRTLGDAGAMAAPVVIGFVIDGFGFRAGFVVASGFLLVTALAAAVLTAQPGAAPQPAAPHLRDARRARTAIPPGGDP